MYQLYTIGEHVGVAREIFITELKALGVRTLADLREKPTAGRCQDLHRSRALSKAFTTAAIQYSFWGDRLGAGIVDGFDDDTLSLQVRALLTGVPQPVCFLSTNREPSKCHRFRICDVLHKAGAATVWHLCWEDHLNARKHTHVDVAAQLRRSNEFFSACMREHMQARFGATLPQQSLQVVPWENVTETLLADGNSYRLKLPFDTELLWYPAWLSKEDADQLFKHLQGVRLEYPTCSFAQPNGIAKNLLSKRGVARYCEDFKQRHQQTSQEQDVEARRFEPWARTLLEQVGEASETTFNNIWLNEYKDGRVGITWHTDLGHQGLGPDPVIGSLSVGATRNFHLKSKGPINGKGPARISFQLGHGDLLVMGAGSQRHWLHSVQPEDAEGLRFNLTFRFYAREEDLIVHSSDSYASVDKDAAEDTPTAEVTLPGDDVPDASTSSSSQTAWQLQIPTARDILKPSSDKDDISSHRKRWGLHSLHVQGSTQSSGHALQDSVSTNKRELHAQKSTESSERALKDSISPTNRGMADDSSTLPGHADCADSGPHDRLQNARSQIALEVCRLNAHVLQTPLKCSEVIEPLSSAGIIVAMDILAEIEASGSKIMDPGKYVRRLLDSRSFIRSSPEARKPPGGKRATVERLVDQVRTNHQQRMLGPQTGRVWRAPGGRTVCMKVATDANVARASSKSHAEACLKSPTKNEQRLRSKIKLEIGRLNGHVLKERVDFHTVVEPLAKVGACMAMGILNDLERSASTVTDANNYVLRLARQTLGIDATKLPEPNVPVNSNRVVSEEVAKAFECLPAEAIDDGQAEDSANDPAAIQAEDSTDESAECPKSEFQQGASEESADLSSSWASCAFSDAECSRGRILTEDQVTSSLPLGSQSAEESSNEAGGLRCQPSLSSEASLRSTAALLCNKKAREALIDGLSRAGFKLAGREFFLEPVCGATVEISSKDIYVNVDDRRAEDIDAFVKEALNMLGADCMIDHAGLFGQRLLQWVRNSDADVHEQEVDVADVVVGCEGVNTSMYLDLSPLPKTSDLCASADRQLDIVTYGCSVLPTRPQAQRHYCIDQKGIRYRMSGRDAAKWSGLDEIIQARVCRCALFANWITEVVCDIEEHGLKDIAIFCWKGRHRSVAAAEILKRVYYPKAAVQHLCL